MSDQPKPAGEWTTDMVILMGCDAYVAANAIADAHNAAIVAERRSEVAITAKMLEEHEHTIEQLREQLAAMTEQLSAEREKVRDWERCAVIPKDKRDWNEHLRIQLAAEVEKVNKLNQQLATERGERRHTGGRMECRKGEGGK